MRNKQRKERWVAMTHTLAILLVCIAIASYITDINAITSYIQQNMYMCKLHACVFLCMSILETKA